MTFPVVFAVTNWGILMLGLLNRKKRRLHAPLMLCGIFSDLGLVLYLQLARDAVGTALNTEMGYLQLFHVLSSSTATLLYFPVLYLGIRLWRYGPTLATRRWHLTLALPCFAFRTIGLVLMFAAKSH